MFFSVSKLFWFVFAPSHILIWMTAAAAVLLFLRRERIARWLVTGAAVLFVAFGILPAGVWLMHPIENQYSRPDWPAHVDGILVLGGGLDAPVLRSRGVIGVNGSVARLISAYELARRYPNARVIFSGGSWAVNGGKNSESIVAGHVFMQMGLAPDRLILEGKSRNTSENFIFSKNIAKPRPDEVWVLATSAFQMPRAMAIAKHVGWKMIPWPTDYMTARGGHYHFSEVPENLQRTDLAVHEWLGLLAYRLSGKAAAAP